MSAPLTETDQNTVDGDAPVTQPPAAAPAGSPAVRRYAHVLKALDERPWAVQRSVLAFMRDFLTFRANGGALSVDEISSRLAAAAAANGARNGGGVAGTVAVIPMYGVISQRQSLMSETSGGTSIDGLREDFRIALADPKVSAIVFDIDSPGGSVDGVTEFAQELRQARVGAKPIVAQIDTLCASAAYWLAANCAEIVITPSGEVGSIGVFAVHEDISRAADAAGVTTTLISAGPYKTEGNQFEPLSDAARTAMQSQVDSFYSMFLGDVAKGRRVSVDTVAADYGQGRTLLAGPAMTAGVVDRIDTLEATVRRLQAPPKAAPASRRGPNSLNAAGAAADIAWNQRMRGMLNR